MNRIRICPTAVASPRIDVSEPNEFSGEMETVAWDDPVNRPSVTVPRLQSVWSQSTIDGLTGKPRRQHRRRAAGARPSGNGSREACSSRS